MGSNTDCKLLHAHESCQVVGQFVVCLLSCLLLPTEGLEQVIMGSNTPTCSCFMSVKAPRLWAIFDLLGPLFIYCMLMVSIH